MSGKKTSLMCPILIAPLVFRIVVPDAGYLVKVHALCKRHKVLLICDEIQTVSLDLFFVSSGALTEL